MKEKTCCFTGHRKIPQEEYNGIVERTHKAIIKLIEEGVEYFIAGGALGFDTLAAQAVLQLKNRYKHIKLILALPCMTQTKGWSESNVVIYEDIKLHCDKFIYTSKEYVKGCMFKRNRFLVDNSSYCIAYLTETKGGTAYTVKYAQEKNLHIINTAKDETMV